MSTFPKEEVVRLADLARIALTDEEAEKMAEEFGVISDAVASVAEVAKSDIPATSHPVPLTNVFRDDVIGPGLNRDDVLAMAPDAEDGKFSVPQILGEE